VEEKGAREGPSSPRGASLFNTARVPVLRTNLTKGYNREGGPRKKRKNVRARQRGTKAEKSKRAVDPRCFAEPKNQRVRQERIHGTGRKR